MAYDDFLADAYTDQPESDSQRTVQDALKRYFAFHELDRAKDSVIHRILRGIEGSDANLERQKLELDVQMRKRSLGMLDTEDLDASMNSHSKGALASLGVRAFNSLPALPEKAGRLKRFALGIL